MLNDPSHIACSLALSVTLLLIPFVSCLSLIPFIAGRKSRPASFFDHSNIHHSVLNPEPPCRRSVVLVLPPTWKLLKALFRTMSDRRPVGAPVSVTPSDGS